MQYGFMPGIWTADAILVLKRLTEKFRSKGKKLFYVFIDLAFNRVRKVTFFYNYDLIQHRTRQHSLKLTN